MKVRLPLDPDHRNAMGAVSTGALSPRVDRTASRVLTEAIALHSLDPALGEMIRWRNARRQDCQLCQSYRDPAARAAGVDDATLAAVDNFESSDLTPAQKAALRFVDAHLANPDAVPDDVLRALGLDQGPAPV
jgi:alkylhydroperoxidase family enzyme